MHQHSQKWIRPGLAIVLGVALATVPAVTRSADDAKTTQEPVTKAPDLSKYKFVKDMTGEIVKADASKITIRVKFAKTAPNPNPRVKVPNVTEGHKDYDYQMLPESLVRSRMLPIKLDENGKKVAHTQKEKEALKLPMGYPGYAATLADLKAGANVYVYLVRDKSISEAKATDDDLRVKYVVIEPPPETTK
jgi:hypothetical protein